MALRLASQQLRRSVVCSQGRAMAVRGGKAPPPFARTAMPESISQVRRADVLPCPRRWSA